jgi:hypothetical protein
MQRLLNCKLLKPSSHKVYQVIKSIKSKVIKSKVLKSIYPTTPIQLDWALAHSKKKS